MCICKDEMCIESKLCRTKHLHTVGCLEQRAQVGGSFHETQPPSIAKPLLFRS
jgi:hypothetical protein